MSPARSRLRPSGHEACGQKPGLGTHGGGHSHRLHPRWPPTPLTSCSLCLGGGGTVSQCEHCGQTGQVSPWSRKPPKCDTAPGAARQPCGRAEHRNGQVVRRCRRRGSSGAARCVRAVRKVTGLTLLRRACPFGTRARVTPRSRQGSRARKQSRWWALSSQGGGRPSSGTGPVVTQGSGRLWMHQLTLALSASPA